MKAQELLDNYDLIMSSMRQYHEMFARMALVGRPVITDQIPTAAVTFNKDGRFLDFLFNEKFLEKLSWEEVRFVCCHEMDHIIKQHSKRFDFKDPVSNIATDIEINEGLVRDFGFEKHKLPALRSKDIGIQDVENVFGRDSDLSTDLSAEQYFNRIKKDPPEHLEGLINGSPTGQGGLDSHEGLVEITEEELKEVLTDALDGDEEKVEKILESMKKGNEDSKQIFDSIYKHTPKKRKWEAVPAQIRKTLLKEQNAPAYQFIKPSRRISCMPKDFILPSKNKVNTKDFNKWDLYLFQDVSGSCVHYFDRFVNAARSIPTDVFNVRFFTFSTRVDEINLNKIKTPGGGGTSFRIIEDHIQKVIDKENKSYPKLVWVITDGMGDQVVPERPDNWAWFLTDVDEYHREYYERCIPSKSKTFLLSDFDDG